MPKTVMWMAPANRLRGLGYELAQGYLLAKPMPIDAPTAQVRAEARVRPTAAD
jgi:EAL domain-containing protein (putative c-di-GMP-specific phosphodiesterase class I)